jgi:urease accessory protein
MTEKAVSVERGGAQKGVPVADSVVLGYADRFVRRKRLVTEAGVAVMIDLPETVSLNDGDALRLESGGLIGVRAADEDLIAVTGPDLARLAWHVGNRHTPCQISPDRLLIQRDHVLEAMLTGLGATLAPVATAFRPEGGAYGQGRTLGHDHGVAGGWTVHHHGASHPRGPGREDEADSPDGSLAAG